jgi:hypothetical protein
MDGFLEILYKVGSEPWSWAVVAALALLAAGSVWRLVRCPIANLRVEVTPESASELLNKRIRHPLSFLVLMLGGMVAAVVGLFRLADPDDGSVLAFFLLSLGLFVVLTLPVRMRIKDAELRVVAAADEARRAVYATTLRHEHRALLLYEFGILAFLALVLLAF